MFEPIKILTAENFNTDEVHQLLDDHFHPELSVPGSMWFDGKQCSEEESQELWATRFRQSLPRMKCQRLAYICINTSEYWNQNLVGSVCQKYIWPEFFRAFRKGKILLVELGKDWFTPIWRGQFTYSEQVEYQKTNPAGLAPQEMSGLQADIFPLNVLLVAAYGIYPLVLFDYAYTFGHLVFVYIPDQAIKYSQMTEAGSYAHVLWRFHHVFDDQWTFDSSRGPKSSTPPKRVKPTRNIEYIEWMIHQINNRMHDLLSISDPLQREQLAMTFSRAVCDCVLAVSSQLPYMSKVFLFACLDKLANTLVQVTKQKSETEAWKQIVDVSFLEGELLELVKRIPCSAGEVLASTVSWVAETLKIDKLTPDILRDFRNSHHGYGLRADTVERLFRHSGELHNDITLIATPLVLYVLSKSWAP